MSRDGAGTYNLPQPPFVSGTVISSTAVNSDFSDIAAALTQSISKDGQTPITANLPMSGYRHTGVGNASARTDYAAAGQVQDGAFIWCGTAGGTANALTLSPTPAISAYAAGQVFRFTAGASPNSGATTVAVSGLTAIAIQNAGAALTGGEIAAGRQYSILYDGANFQLQSFQLGGVADRAVTPIKLSSAATPLLADGRLTLTTGVPVTTSDVTAASTLFYTPHVGNRIALYDGTNWLLYTFTERSLALSGLVSGRPYDVFIYDNSGTLTLELTAWTNDTTRATALVRQDGVLVRSGATTRRYLGTIYTTGTTTTEDSVANRYVWNNYNRVRRPMSRADATATWTYTTATWRQANGAAANQLNFVQGDVGDSIDVFVQATASNTSSVVMSVGIGINSTTVDSSVARTTNQNPSSATLVASGLSSAVAVGRNFLAWLEISTATGTTTFVGTTGHIRSAIFGSVSG